MSNIAIVTDSTAYIPPELAAGKPIFIVPLQVVWGEESYRDGVDIQPQQFYEKLVGSKIMPTTSQPSPAAFMELYQRLLAEGHDEIISIHISSRLSGTVDSAIQAKAMLPESSISVVDSYSTSMPLAYLALEAAKAISMGASLQECTTLVENARERTGVYFMVDTLEFLHRGGRIGGASAFLGTLMDLKPILQLKDGCIEAVERVRTRTKALSRMVDLAAQNVNGTAASIQLAVLHSNVPNEAAEMKEHLREYFHLNPAQISISQLSPVIGTHAGPGCLGLAFYKTK